MDDRTIVICYDGSLAAQAAIERVAELWPGGLVTILTAWQPIEAYALARLASIGSIDDIDRSITQAAQELADEGVQRAREAGLVATGTTTPAGARVGHALLEWCDAEGADLIVVGASGDSALSDAMTGSVAAHVMHHTATPVLLVHRKRAAPAT